MTTLDEVRLGLAARLDTITGLRVHDLVPATIDPPAAFIALSELEYRGPTDSVMDAIWGIGLAVSTGDPRQQLQLYPMLERTGAWSVFAAIEADRTLGGLNVDIIALTSRGFGQQELGGNKYYVASIDVHTWIS